MKKLLLSLATITTVLTGCFVSDTNNETAGNPMAPEMQTMAYAGTAIDVTNAYRRGVIKYALAFMPSTADEFVGSTANCSATMIGPDLFLTAAHCMTLRVPDSYKADNKISSSEIRYFTIAYDDPQTNEKLTWGTSDDVEAYIHPDYDPEKPWLNDAAIIHKKTGNFFSAINNRDNFLDFRFF